MMKKDKRSLPTTTWVKLKTSTKKRQKQELLMNDSTDVKYKNYCLKPGYPRGNPGIVGEGLNKVLRGFLGNSIWGQLTEGVFS